MKATAIKKIVIHCTAGFGNLASIQSYWKSLGWRTGGYHRVIATDGTIHKLYEFSHVTNGVKGYNHECIHISYIGGVDPNNYKVAKDTRTEEQKFSILSCIMEAQEWIADNGGNPAEVQILGHRDLSPDLNNNGIIEPNERSKECPSFDAIPEYKNLQQ